MRTLARAALARVTGAAIASGTLTSAAIASAGFPSVAAAQVAPAGAPATPAKPSREAKVFRSETPLPITFTVNIKRIRGDRGDSVPWRRATLSLADEDGKPVTIPVRVRTRGIWRRRNCEFPPIRLNFTAEIGRAHV